MLLCFVRSVPSNGAKREIAATKTKRDSSTGKKVQLNGFVFTCMYVARFLKIHHVLTNIREETRDSPLKMRYRSAKWEVDVDKILIFKF